MQLYMPCSIQKKCKVSALLGLPWRISFIIIKPGVASFNFIVNFCKVTKEGREIRKPRSHLFHMLEHIQILHAIQYKV